MVKDQLVVLDGSTFFVTNLNGDCQPSQESGFFFNDVRHLSTWELLLDGAPMRLLTSRAVEYYEARIFGTLRSARVGANPPITVRRHRAIADGLHEELVVVNSAGEAQRVNLELRVGADFADLFEVKAADGPRKRGTHHVASGPRRLTLAYERDGFHRRTVIAVDADCDVTAERIAFDLCLAPHEEWRASIEVTCHADGVDHPPRRRHGERGKLQPHMPMTIEQWMDGAPRLETSHDPLHHCYRQSLLDLAALRFRPSEKLDASVPAAGLPWFMTVFGRDSLLTSYMALPFHSELARTVLRALAGLQATERDDYRDASPGKIVHEVRRGELAALGETPSPYYGSADATPLFCILLDEYERWSGDADLVRELEPAARAALGWIEGDGDRGGYVAYERRSSKGLVNQCWKDSWNSMRFADGRVASAPIATCEIQGYAFDARRRLARLAREIWKDPDWAERLERDADALSDRFNRDFWSAERGHYVLALDHNGDQVDALTSNTGQLLWSGIVDAERAPGVVERLMGEELYSGWGVRTMSTRDAGYNPIEYHNGTVWPHDNALIAEGLRRYGYREEASRLAVNVIEAAAAFDYRLPEVFAGFPRAETDIPVEYPTACQPQAWAAAAPLLALRTLLGLDVADGGLRVDPHLPPRIASLALHGVQVRGQAATAYAGLRASR